MTGTSRLETAKPIIGPPMTIFARPGLQAAKIIDDIHQFRADFDLQIGRPAIPLPAMVMTFSYRRLVENHRIIDGLGRGYIVHHDADRRRQSHRRNFAPGNRLDELFFRALRIFDLQGPHRDRNIGAGGLFGQPWSSPELHRVYCFRCRYGIL